MARTPRPGLLDKIDMGPGQGTAPATANVVEIARPSEPMRPAAPATVKTSLYLPHAAHRKLKEIAFAQDCKVHDLVVQGINRILQENGYPTVQELGGERL